MTDNLKFDENGLIPCIAVDAVTKSVLMMAYMNRESYELTIKTGKMTYFSRSRNKLWIKGEESGNTQLMKEIFYDCDKDTLLAEVEQTGPACHTGSRSCFYDDSKLNGFSMEILFGLMSTIKDRKINPKEGSYTNYLFDSGIDKILKKVGEESAEVIIAAKNNSEEVIYETSDLIYHLLVMLEKLDIKFEDVLKELAKRR